MEYWFGEYILIFKALSDETRLRIIMMLTKGRTCACKILEEFHFTQPTLSYHMKQLTDSGIVGGEKEGKWVYYTLNSERIKILYKFLSKLTPTLQNLGECED